MIPAKTNQELTYMKKAGIIVALAHRAAQQIIQPGITTKQIDDVVEKTILENGGIPSFKGLYGHPSAACISVNSTLVHGIPSDTTLHSGDIVSVDIGACYHGYHGDSAWTYAVGKPHQNIEKLMQIGEKALFEGLKMARAGNHLTDISHAIGEFIFSQGCSTPRDYAGHGIGTSVHEDPTVPNFGPPGQGIILEEGMTLAIEPVVMAGRPQTIVSNDGSIISKDGKYTVHYEHTIVITKDGYEILTTIKEEEQPDNG